MYFSIEFLQKIYRVGFLIVIILLIADLLAFFYYPESTLGDIFLATREQTPLTWVSSLAMLSIAMSSFSTYNKTKEKIWYFLSITFFFFSMDDAVYFHERLSGFFVDNTELFSFFPSYIWVVIYFPILAFSLIALVYLLWKETFGENKKMVIIAIIMLGTAIFLDLVDGFVQKDSSIVLSLNHFHNSIFIHLMRLTEEVLEVLALGILGYINIKKHCLIDKCKN